jgi:protein TonB
MFESALLESSPRRGSVLRPIHYLSSILTGAVVFALACRVLPLLVGPAGERPLAIAAGLAGAIAASYALVASYVWADNRQQRQSPWPWLGLVLLLNLPGFLVYLVYSARRTGDWKRAAIPLAYVAESMLVGVLVLVPLIYTQALPRQLLIDEIHIPPPPGPPHIRATAKRAQAAPHTNVDLRTAPTTIPKGVTPVVESPRPTDSGAGVGVIGAPQGAPSGEAWKWVVSSLTPNDTGPPPPPLHVASKPRLYRLGGDVVAARAIYQPRPVYPPLATMARIQGAVVLQAIIGTDGTIQDLKVQSGHPLLVRAALDAVHTWRYQPTLLNNEPAEVLTEITVNFRLGE